MPDDREMEIEIFQNSGGKITNLARPAANGDKIGYSCGVVGKALSCKTVKGIFGGRRSINK